ncbi:MAG: sugar transferase [Chloroflexota bacterium]|nr:sugar transferase [Chloroflexota bacterium]
MIRRFGPILLAFQFVMDLALTLLAVKIGEQLRLHIVTSFERREQFVAVQPSVYLLVIGVWALFFFLLGVFDPRRRASLLSELGNLWLSITISMLVLASFFYLLAIYPPVAPSRLFYGYFYLLDLGLLTLGHVTVWRTLSSLRRGGRHVRRVLLVGGGIHGRHVAVRLRGRETVGVMLVGYVTPERDDQLPGLTRLGAPDDLLEVVRDHVIDEVVVALPAAAHADALKVVSVLQATDVNVRILPDVFEVVAMKAGIEDFYGLPLISIREPSINPVQARVKRLFDLCVAGFALVLFSPLMLAVAIWVRFDSAGPIVIHQRRVGAGGNTFFMHKFRSMDWRPEELDTIQDKKRDDPRVTGAGRFIRRTSLDELPQLWNVVKGEMSVVGPRPELPAIVELYEPWQMKRFAVPPGMTGWWQVNGRSERSMSQNTEIDLYYVQNYSILLDLQILARTLGAVIRGRGAY